MTTWKEIDSRRAYLLDELIRRYEDRERGRGEALGSATDTGLALDLIALELDGIRAALAALADAHT